MTPLARRRPQIAARPVLAIDHLSSRRPTPRQGGPSANFDVFDFDLTADQLFAIDALDTGVRGPSTAHRTKNTGTEPVPTRSWNTWQCSTTLTTRPPPRPGWNTSPTTNTWLNSFPSHPYGQLRQTDLIHLAIRWCRGVGVPASPSVVLPDTHSLRSQLWAALSGGALVVATRSSIDGRDSYRVYRKLCPSVIRGSSTAAAHQRPSRSAR